MSPVERAADPEIPDIELVWILDPLIDDNAPTALDDYFELFWLPVVGPSSWVVMRTATRLLLRAPEVAPGTRAIATTTHALGRPGGLGGRGTRRGLGRLEMFGLARRVAPDSDRWLFRVRTSHVPTELAVKYLTEPALEVWARHPITQRARGET